MSDATTPAEPRSPTREQAKAIGVRGRDVLLEAGAGTGKTGVLVDRYCDLIAAERVAPDAILAFTFTDRAAAQLRDRVRRELQRRMRAGSDEELAAHLAAVLNSFGGAWITTIHGFCRRLLAAHPIAAGIDPRFRVLDASESSRVARAAFDQALEDFLSVSEDERETTVAAYGIERLREMIAGAHAELRSRGEDPPRLTQPPPGDLIAALGQLEARAAAAIGAAQEREAQRRKLDRALEICADSDRCLPTLDQLDELYMNKPSGPRGEFAEALRAARSRAAEAGAGGVAFGHVAELLETFDRRLAEQKTARSGLEFEDLQLLAVRLLRGSEVGSLYRDRFAHLLVDEFQDTNRLQLTLIESLKGPQTEIFYVGDEFQSIYGFRHADLEVFRGQREALEAAARAEVLPLSGNFRSCPEVIAAANAIGERLLHAHRPLTVGSEPEPGEPRGGGSAVELLLTDCRGWDEEGIDLQLRVNDATRPEFIAEARGLAARLRELADAGVPRGEMVVLLRAFTHVDAIEEALQRAGLRPYVVGGRGYWSQQQVEDVRCLVSVVANPLDDEPLLGALASPACGVLPDTLWILRRAAGGGRHLWPALQRAVGAWDAELAEPDWLEQIPADDGERLRAFHSRIEALRVDAPRLALDELIERATWESGYEEAVLMRGSGELRLSNIRKLMRLAREFEANEGRSLRGFLDFIAFRTGQDDEAVAATEAEDHDGVRVMTTHSAKGLEFPVVAVADLGRSLTAGAWPSDLNLAAGADGSPRVGMRFARLGAPSADLYERRRILDEGSERGVAEELRLFYVAATRARERLLLSGVTAKQRPREAKPSTPVTERLIEAFEVGELDQDTTVALPAPQPRPGLDATFGEAAVTVRVNRASPERAAELVRRSAAPPPVRAAGEGPPPIVELPSPLTPRRPLSYSALDQHRRCGYRFYIERILGLGQANDEPQGSEAGPRSREERFGFGSAVHELLEWSASRRWLEPSAELIDRTLRANGLDSGDPALRERALASLRGWTESELCAGLSARPAKLRAEVPLLLGIGGSVLRGSIDLLAESPGESPTVVDYKSDRLDGEKPAARAGRYELQRDLYGLAVASATGAERVRVAYVFLENPGEPVLSELGPEEITLARGRLEAAVAEISAERFEVTTEPDWPLCHDCPARPRLCSGPAEDPAAA